MKALKKIDLLDRIGRELQSRMTYSEIDTYFAALGVDYKDVEPSSNSKWVYVKEVLADAENSLLISVADELELEHDFTTTINREATFWKAGHLKLFLSHLASFKVNTSRLQQALSQYAISAFVAHEDIQPSKEWLNEIELALQTMDAMVALLMPGFKESNWCDQEVGIAVAKDVLIIPVRKGLDPYGFIGKYQGIQAANKNIGEVATEIYETLISSPKTKSKLIRAIADAIAQSTELEDANSKLQLLADLTAIPEELLERLKSGISENSLLIKSHPFIADVNKVLGKNSVGYMSAGGTKDKLDWDDEIPF